jgi:integrase
MGRRHLKLPHGCQRYIDHTGTLRTYYRHTKPRTALPGLPWSPEFMQAYEAAVARAGLDKPLVIGASRTKPGSLNAALVRYYGSDDYAAMAPDVRSQNRGYLEKWRVDRGDRPLRQLQHKHVQGYINQQATPTVQRNVLRAIRHFLKFCLRTNLIDSDASAGVVKSKIIKTGGFRPWTEEEVDKYVARWPVGTTPHLALQIMLCLSVRRSDAIEIGPRHVRKTAEHPLGVLENYQPKKGRRTGGRLISCPLHPDLVAAIDAMDVIGTETFLITKYGKPFGNRGFGSRMREWTDAAGIPPITDVNGKVKNAASHGLRKLCLTRLAEAGCTVVEMQGISGHKDLKELALYIDAANRKKAAAQAMKKLLAAQGADQNRNVVCLTGQDS